MIVAIHGLFRGRDQQAQAYIDAIKAVPGATLSGTEELAILALFDDLKGANLFDKICLFLPMIGGVLDAYRINMINPVRTVTTTTALSEYKTGIKGLRFDRGGTPPANLGQSNVAAFLTDIQLVMSPGSGVKTQVGRFDNSIGVFISEQYSFNDTTDRVIFLSGTASGGFYTWSQYITAPGNNTTGYLWASMYNPGSVQNRATVSGKTFAKGFYAVSVFQNGPGIITNPFGVNSSASISNIEDSRWATPQTIRLCGWNNSSWAQLPNAWTSSWYISRGMSLNELNSFKEIITKFNNAIGR